MTRTQNVKEYVMTIYFIQKFTLKYIYLAPIWWWTGASSFWTWPEIPCRFLLRPSNSAVFPSSTYGQPLYSGPSKEASIGSRHCKYCHITFKGILLTIFFQCKGTAKMTNILIGSNLFSAQHAAKKLGKSNSKFQNVCCIVNAWVLQCMMVWLKFKLCQIMCQDVFLFGQQGDVITGQRLNLVCSNLSWVWQSVTFCQKVVPFSTTTTTDVIFVK